jgi:hypothetical protein
MKINGHLLAFVFIVSIVIIILTGGELRREAKELRPHRLTYPHFFSLQVPLWLTSSGDSGEELTTTAQ